MAHVKYLLMIRFFTLLRRIDMLHPDEHGMVGKDLKFDRIRRITGYLVGSVNRWNNAKKAELKDRVLHTSSK